MESTVTGYKEHTKLFFERDGKTIFYDLKELNFFKKLKNGEVRPVENPNGFFRKVTVPEIAGGFKDRAYGELMKKVFDAVRYDNRRLKNFGAIFQRMPKYAHLESHLILGVRFSGASTFHKPASIYSKPVLQFMIESQIVIGTRNWEERYEKYPKLFTDLCNHVRTKHYLDLEVYGMLYSLLTGNRFNEFILMSSPRNVSKKELFPNDYYYGNDGNSEKGYGCEYKALFDYCVRTERVEATNFNAALNFYYDYLKMGRKIEHEKEIRRVQKAWIAAGGEPLSRAEAETLCEVDSYGRIEKYPRYLKIRHDVVTRNYNALQNEVDEEVFKSNVNYDLEYNWGGYKMIAPKTSQDIKDEGTSLHHCVASYVNKVMNGTTQIIFMRQFEDSSLVTVEVRAGEVTQTGGYDNRKLSQDEKKWLETWAKNKNITYGSYRRDEKRAEKEAAVLEAEKALELVDRAEEISNEVMANAA